MPLLVFIARLLRIAPMGGAFEQLQRLLIFRVRTNAAIKPGDRFGVVVKNVGPGDQHIVQSACSSPLKSGIRTSTLHSRIHFADLRDRLGPVHRAAVGQVVAID